MMIPERTQNQSAAAGAATSEAEVEALLVRAGQGDAAAHDELLARHRARLWRMIAVRLDRRMAARVDASDIVQDALTEAAGRLSDYVSSRPLPFYPWLRHIAWQHLSKCQRRHISTRRRSVAPSSAGADSTEASSTQLAELLVADDTSPSGRAIRGEERQRVQAALALPAASRPRGPRAPPSRAALARRDCRRPRSVGRGCHDAAHPRSSACAACWSWAKRRNDHDGRPTRNRDRLAAGEHSESVPEGRAGGVSPLSWRSVAHRTEG